MIKNIGIGKLATIIPELTRYVGNEFVILDEKKKQIVGKIKVLEAPKMLSLTEKYVRKYVRKGVKL